VADWLSLLEILSLDNKSKKTLTRPFGSLLLAHQLGGQNILSAVIAQQEPSLQIVSQSSFISDIGSLHIVGEVANNSPSVAKFVRIVGTFYDTNNRVVGTSFTFTQPPDLVAGDTSPFELILSSASIPIQEVDHYVLKLTWQTGGTQGIEQQTIQGPRGDISKTEIECGSIIMEMATLTKDLVCNTDGIIIGGDNDGVNA